MQVRNGIRNKGYVKYDGGRSYSNDKWANKHSSWQQKGKHYGGKGKGKHGKDNFKEERQYTHNKWDNWYNSNEDECEERPKLREKKVAPPWSRIVPNISNKRPRLLWNNTR